MTIYLYSGTPGSGKSLHAAKDIFEQLRNNRPMICNFEIDLSRICKNTDKISDFLYIPNEELDVNKLVDFAQTYWAGHGGKVKEGRIKLYLDECQLLFNSRSYQQKSRMQWLSFFSQHRHYGFDIYLIAQFDRMLDRQIRCLIEYEYMHRKFSNLGKGGKFFSLFAAGKLFMFVKTYYPLREKVGSKVFVAHKRYWSIYDTWAVFDAPSDTPSKDVSRPLKAAETLPAPAMTA